jgi:hypothetical protein
MPRWSIREDLRILRAGAQLAASGAQRRFDRSPSRSAISAQNGALLPRGQPRPAVCAAFDAMTRPSALSTSTRCARARGSSLRQPPPSRRILCGLCWRKCRPEAHGSRVYSLMRRFAERPYLPRTVDEDRPVRQPHGPLPRVAQLRSRSSSRASRSTLEPRFLIDPGNSAVSCSGWDASACATPSPRSA